MPARDLKRPERYSPFLDNASRSVLTNRLNLSNPDPARIQTIERPRPNANPAHANRSNWVRCENCGLKYDTQKSKKIHQRYYCVGKDMPKVKIQYDRSRSNLGMNQPVGPETKIKQVRIQSGRASSELPPLNRVIIRTPDLLDEYIEKNDRYSIQVRTAYILRFYS